MSSPRSIKDIQKLTGRIAALNRFISRTVDKYLSQEAFTNLKAYLSSPPLLISPKAREKLYLYLAASEETLTVVLIKETSKGQLLIYYVNKAFHDSKLNYSKIEKLAYSFLMASRKLRQYF